MKARHCVRTQSHGQNARHGRSGVSEEGKICILLLPDTLAVPLTLTTLCEGLPSAARMSSRPEVADVRTMSTLFGDRRAVPQELPVSRRCHSRGALDVGPGERKRAPWL